MHSFLLIGQSNMAGRGKISEAVSVDTSRIYTLRNGRWQNMFRPIHSDRSFAGVCLAESFAEAYAKKYNVEVGLICCADGGTSLDQWQEGELLYDNAIFQAKLAQRTSTIVGVLWHQGEADCPPELSATYKLRFEKMMSAFRRDLQLENTPFIIGELGDFLADCPLGPYLKFYKDINKQLISIAEDNQFVRCVSAEKLGANEDLLHFNSKSLYEFGLRYFDEFEKLFDFQKINIQQSCGKITTEMESL